MLHLAWSRGSPAGARFPSGSGAMLFHCYFFDHALPSHSRRDVMRMTTPLRVLALFREDHPRMKP